MEFIITQLILTQKLTQSVKMDLSLYNKLTNSQKLTPEENEIVKSLRVVQNSVIYVIGLKQEICDEELLKSEKFFGQYGEVENVRINRTNLFTVKKDKKKYCRAYISYKNPMSASLAILSINLKKTEGLSKIDASFSATKLCKFFVKQKPCLVKDCHFMHSLDSFDQVLEEGSHVSKVLKFDSQKDFVFTNGLNYLSGVSRIGLPRGTEDVSDSELDLLVKARLDNIVTKPSGCVDIPEEDLQLPNYKIGLKYLEKLQQSLVESEVEAAPLQSTLLDTEEETIKTKEAELHQVNKISREFSCQKNFSDSASDIKCDSNQTCIKAKTFLFGIMEEETDQNSQSNKNEKETFCEVNMESSHINMKKMSMASDISTKATIEEQNSTEIKKNRPTQNLNT